MLRDTPLMRAVQKRYSTIVGIILGAGADVYAKNRDGKDALYYAKSWDREAVQEMLNATASAKKAKLYIMYGNSNQSPCNPTFTMHLRGEKNTNSDVVT